MGNPKGQQCWRPKRIAGVDIFGPLGLLAMVIIAAIAE